MSASTFAFPGRGWVAGSGLRLVAGLRALMGWAELRISADVAVLWDAPEVVGKLVLIYSQARSFSSRRVYCCPSTGLAPVTGRF